MTSLATVLGLAPMALGIGEGSETNMPLARAVIGGLLVSTFMTLLFVPVLHVLARGRRTDSEQQTKSSH
jgi:multidrug efflux pump subunit AcrB